MVPFSEVSCLILNTDGTTAVVVVLGLARVIEVVEVVVDDNCRSSSASSTTR